MEPNNKPFPIYQLQDAFEAFCNSEPTAKPQHRSLYYYLLGYCRRRGNTPRFSLAYEAGMHGSGIGSWATYDAALKALAEWGFIVYTPGANRFKVPVVELTFRNPTDDVLLTYWQSYCLSTANPTDDVPLTLVVTLKEELKKERREIEKLESEKTQHQADKAAADAALGEAQKKIEELEVLRARLAMLEEENTALKTQPSAAHTEGGAADVPTRKPPTLQAQRGGKQLMADSPLAAYPAFAAAWLAAATANPDTYAELDQADLKHYHAALGDWSAAGGHRKTDWLATIRGSMRRDLQDNRLRRLPQFTPTTSPQAHAVYRSNTGYGANSAAARLQTPQPDASSANPWGLPGRG